jgi:hypothetical protein
MVSFTQSKLTENQPRDDYRKLLELTMVFLGHSANQSFCLPGAFHHAKWMAKAIYYIKVYEFIFAMNLNKQKHKKKVYVTYQYFWFLYVLKHGLMQY